jgi:type III restriction enzyme
VYSWQPALLAQRLTDPRVAFEPIPAFPGQSLRRTIFGGQGRTAMSAPAPKGYQREAVVNALEIFRYAESQFRQAGDDASRAAATAFNGCLLLEAPTGSGKTLMAGMIAETFAAPDREAMRANRLVLVYALCHAGGAGQRGDQVHVCRPARARPARRPQDARHQEWRRVCDHLGIGGGIERKETRKVRSGGEFVLSLDDLIAELRADGFRIGAWWTRRTTVCHGGRGRALLPRTLKPDFTLMMTATPDDQDVEKFKKAAGIGHLHRIRVSRKEAVDAGLIKDGIKSIAYLAADDQKELVDFAATALADGWGMHNAIKQGLQAAGIGLVPLMLVQVANSNKAVDEARTRLAAMGVRNRKLPGTRRTIRTTICWQWRLTSRRKC